MTSLLAFAFAFAPQEASASAPRRDAVPAEAPGDAEVRAAIDRGIAFLLRDQNADGSWGGPRNKTMTDSFANYETHRSWTVATTGLACMALLEEPRGPEAEAAAVRGLDYLAAHAKLGRPADWDIDNTWGFVYGLHGLARALGTPRLAGSPRRGAWKDGAAECIRGLERYQTPEGGWAYYASREAAWRPAGMSTSFQTAAAVLALLDAKAAGIEVPEKVLAAAVKAVRHCRLPSGAYTYGIDAISQPGWAEGINQVKGSLSRIQVCNLALHRAGAGVGVDELRRGLEGFFRDHRFLDAGLRKPIPHEAYYQVAAYFYLFGHYYAAQTLDALPAEERAAHAKRLRPEVLKTQEPDGGFWDFWISGHTKAYGTAFAVMALGRTLEPRG
jgi:hypothetical protein